MPSPSVAHIEAYQPATLAITPFSTFSPIPANVLPHTPASTDSNVQSIVHSIVRAVNWTEVNDMLFPGPEMSQTSQPELPETCEFVLTLTETASPTSKSSETAPSCQPSPDVMSGLERLDTMLDGLLKEFDEAGQSGITLPAHNFGDVTGFSSENVELDVLDITAGNLDEMFDANGDIIVMDSRTIPMVNMDTAMTETHGFGNVLLSPLGCGGGTLETTLIENVPPGISGEGETIFTGNMDTSMTEAHIMEQPCSQANEDYLFAHILAIAVAENETTEKKFPTGVAEVEGSSTAIAVLKNEFKGGAGPPVVVSNL
ncbi:hypothetical protein BC830DRAFT_1140849 [Chytriomyces sp. MP71]|nr:hypothetical protein BC830DRAFT_1140849 [Chytriomyces sp. MP71]